MPAPHVTFPLPNSPRLKCPFATPTLSLAPFPHMCIFSLAEDDNHPQHIMVSRMLHFPDDCGLLILYVGTPISFDHVLLFTSLLLGVQHWYILANPVI
jgi:hypothetical protein